MQNLNDVEAIKKIDPKDTLGSTELLVTQLETAWKEVQSVTLEPFQDIKNIVFCGMGGSIYCALVVRALFGSKFPYPTEVVSDYHLPSYVDESTLVVLSSYSGTTEEVLSCAQEAREKAAKILVLTKGAQLGDFAKANNIPGYIFDGKLNPAGIPRLGNGYTIMGLMGLLQKTNVLQFDSSLLEEGIRKLKTKMETIKQTAKQQASVYQNVIPIIFSAEHLNGNAQIFRNQFNETSKTFSAYYLVPDLNHHLMEGLQFPKESKLRFIALQSKNYTPKNHKRMALTIDVVKQNKHIIDIYETTGDTIFDDFLEIIAYSSYLTLYLGLLYDQNPAVNHWVDYFKQQLAK